MATLTRLASTLTAKYFPSQDLTDAFYIDGRLFGKRETRQADITIDKEERGFFFSVFAHPRIPDYEPGMMPPYEPQLRGTCNEVKFGRKEIDGMIEGFLSTAVDVTGKMKLAGNDDRSPYFSGVIVRDAEAFAVTIGGGLAFLYRDDTLFPLTDAGIPMEPIDANGNKVPDFLYYCSSKTANALWSNFFALSPDDCIILCNKEIYDALGQREILRILTEAEDQCDAAGLIITQASARMPNVPMQFSISFVESVTNDDKKGLFGFKRKTKDDDMSDMSIKSTVDGGDVGAAFAAVADAGFTGGLKVPEQAPTAGSSLFFGDKSETNAPAANQVASEDKGFVIDDLIGNGNGVEFLDPSVEKGEVKEMSAEEMMKNLFGEMKKASEAPSKAEAFVAGTAAAGAAGAAAAASAAAAAGAASLPGAEAAGSIFVAGAAEEVKPAEPVIMEPVSSTTFTVEEDDNSKTKPVTSLDPEFLKAIANPSLTPKEEVKEEIKPEIKEEPVIEEVPAVTPVPVLNILKTEQTKTNEQILQEALDELKNRSEVKSEVDDNNQTNSNPDEIVFAAGNEAINFDVTGDGHSASDASDPYSVGSSEEMLNAAPLVFGDDGKAKAPTEEDLEKASDSEGIPVPEFELKSEKPELTDSDKLAVDFPETTKVEAVAEAKTETSEEAPAEEGFALPFENNVETIPEPVKEEKIIKEDIPDMPVYGGNTFDTPVNAAGSEEPVNAPAQDVYTYGQYTENENMAEITEEEPQAAPYQSYGGEGDVYGQTSQYTDYTNGYQYQPGQYQDYSGQGGYDNGYADPSAAQVQEPVASRDSDWINSILGIDDDVDYSQSAGYAAAAGTAAATGAAGAYGQTDPYSAPESSSGPRPASAQRSSSASSVNRPAAGGAGRGGSGNGGKTIRLNRNGYMFLAFVGVCVICLIVLVCIILKSCGKDDAAVETDPTSNITDVSDVTDESGEQTDATADKPVETEATAATVSDDPSAPIGRFVFSDYIGYRTWWDLFNQVYGIDDLANESDPRIAIIRQYNGLDDSYSPSSGDILILPPMGVLDGTIPMTYVVGAPQTTDAGTGETTAAAEETQAAEEPAA